MEVMCWLSTSMRIGEAEGRGSMPASKSKGGSAGGGKGAKKKALCKA